MILRTSKSIGNKHHEKNATATALALPLQDVLSQTFTVQNKPVQR